MLSDLFSNHFFFLLDLLFWQEHLTGLVAEKEELGQQIDHLLLENRGLLQAKTSLGLEVATYRYAVCAVVRLRLHCGIFQTNKNGISSDTCITDINCLEL